MTDRALAGAPPAGVVPGGQSVVDDLVALLDLEQIELNIFRGVSPAVSLQRVFGGQVAGQALVAAGRTVDPARRVHSLHSYFLRGGDPGVPIVYMVDRLRDGRSFSVRRVVAVQHGEPIFLLSASFQLDQPGIEHALPMPDVPAPETLPTLADRYRGFEEILGPLPRLPRPFDLRYVDDPPWIQRANGARESGTHRIWMRADGVLPDDQLINICALTFASDLTLLDSVLTRHGLSWGFDPLAIASLDHAMWFHRSFRADRWFLYDTSSPTASGSRGLSEGRFFAEDGTQIATVMQEGMIRLGR
jgi:acyl-CoA thioesterase II